MKKVKTPRNIAAFELRTNPLFRKKIHAKKTGKASYTRKSKHKVKYA